MMTRRTFSRQKLFLSIGWIGALLGGNSAVADPYQPSQSLMAEALSAVSPLAYAPVPTRISDYRWEWAEAPLAQVQVEWVPDSLQWVRVSETWVIPRGRIRLKIPTGWNGLVSQGGITQSLSAGLTDHDVTVILSAAPGNELSVELRTDSGERISGKLKFRLNRGLNELPSDRLGVDSTCSPYQVQVKSLASGFKLPDWVFLGCRLTAHPGTPHATSQLEVSVFWDSPVGNLAVSGIEAKALQPGFWRLKLSPEPGFTELGVSSEPSSLRVSYRIPKKFRTTLLGLGVGPYQYTFRAPGADQNGLAPLLTLYGSYFLDDGLRIVAFDAMPLKAPFYTDLGVFLSTRSFSGFDKRLDLNLMFGGHVIAFKALGQTQFQFGFPQGIELMYKDALIRNYNLAAGAFVYPKINEKAYYNLWLRWGSPQFFGELNYISFLEKIQNERIYSRSVGVSFGMPLFRLW